MASNPYQTPKKSSNRFHRVSANPYGSPQGTPSSVGVMTPQPPIYNAQHFLRAFRHRFPNKTQQVLRAYLNRRYPNWRQVQPRGLKINQGSSGIVLLPEFENEFFGPDKIAHSTAILRNITLNTNLFVEDSFLENIDSFYKFRENLTKIMDKKGEQQKKRIAPSRLNLFFSLLLYIFAILQYSGDPPLYATYFFFEKEDGTFHQYHLDHFHGHIPTYEFSYLQLWCFLELIAIYFVRERIPVQPIYFMERSNPVQQNEEKETYLDITVYLLEKKLRGASLEQIRGFLNDEISSLCEMYNEGRLTYQWLQGYTILDRFKGYLVKETDRFVDSLFHPQFLKELQQQKKKKAQQNG